MATSYYYIADSYTPPALLRRVDFRDEAFVKGVWKPTTAIIDWQAGQDDSVDMISESDARRRFPEAFA